MVNRLHSTSERFISRSSKRSYKFFSVLKKRKIWLDTEMSTCTKRFKSYRKNPNLLAKTQEVEWLLVYLAVSEISVSAVLVREINFTQSPISYVRKSLLYEETRYSNLEKLALALITAAQKLRPYFLCHPILIVMTFLLWSIFHKLELSGWLSNWVVKLSNMKYHINLVLSPSLKS